MASWCVSQLTPDPSPKTRYVLFWRQGNVCKTTSQHFIYHIATYYIVHKHFVYHIEGSIIPWPPQPKHGALCCFGTGTFAKPHRNMVHNVLFTTSTLQKNSTLQKKIIQNLHTLIWNILFGLWHVFQTTLKHDTYYVSCSDVVDQMYYIPILFTTSKRSTLQK